MTKAREVADLATAIPASEITGTLPAIDGSSLIGVGGNTTLSSTIPSSPSNSDIWVRPSYGTYIHLDGDWFRADDATEIVKEAVIEELTGSGTYSVPSAYAGKKAIIALSGGGGGGRWSHNRTGGGPGGSGGSAIFRVLDIDDYDGVSYSVGSGGTSTTALYGYTNNVVIGAAGGPGGTTSFGSVQATGGSGKTTTTSGSGTNGSSSNVHSDEFTPAAQYWSSSTGGESSPFNSSISSGGGSAGSGVQTSGNTGGVVGYPYSTAGGAGAIKILYIL